MTKKTTKTPSGDAPKRGPRKGRGIQLWLHELLFRQLEKLVDRNGSDNSEELRAALRKHLEAEGLWPPPSGDGSE